MALILGRRTDDNRWMMAPSTGTQLDARLALVFIKTTHTAIWAVVEGAVVYLLAKGFAGSSGRGSAIAGAIVATETAVYIGNGARCPLSDVAESHGAERGSVTDLFLPRWLAKALPAIHVPLIGLIMWLHLRNLRARRGGARVGPAGIIQTGGVSRTSARFLA